MLRGMNHLRFLPFVFGLLVPACTSLETGGSSDPCEPGVTEVCYSGPAATQDVGPCHAGTRTCAADGNGFGPCTGEVAPQPEPCGTTDDLACDGPTTCTGDTTWKLPLTGEIVPGGIAASSDGEATFFGWAHTIDIGTGSQGDDAVWSLFVARIASDGTARWLRTFPGVDAAERRGDIAMSEAHDATIAIRIDGEVTVEDTSIDAPEGGVLALRFTDDGTLAAANLLDLSGPEGQLEPSPHLVRLAGDNVLVGGAGFLAAVDATLATTWHHRYAGDVTFEDIATSPDGARYAVGTYQGEFEPGGGAGVILSNHAGFTARLDGADVVWSETVGGDVETTALSLFVRADGYLRIAGTQAGGGELIDHLGIDGWTGFVADRFAKDDYAGTYFGWGPRRPESMTPDGKGDVVVRLRGTDEWSPTVLLKGPNPTNHATIHTGGANAWALTFDWPPVTVTLPSGETIVATSQGVRKLAR